MDPSVPDNVMSLEEYVSKFIVEEILNYRSFFIHKGFLEPNDNYRKSFLNSLKILNRTVEPMNIIIKFYDSTVLVVEI